MCKVQLWLWQLHPQPATPSVLLSSRATLPQTSLAMAPVRVSNLFCQFEWKGCGCLLLLTSSVFCDALLKCDKIVASQWCKYFIVRDAQKKNFQAPPCSRVYLLQ